MDTIRIDLAGAPLGPAHVVALRQEFYKRHELAPDWGMACPWAFVQVAALSMGIVVDPKDLDKGNVSDRMNFGGIMVYHDATVPDGTIEFYRARDQVGAIVNIGRPRVAEETSTQAR